jgi:hypothetical protein
MSRKFHLRRRESAPYEAAATVEGPSDWAIRPPHPALKPPLVKGSSDLCDDFLCSDCVA